MTAYDTFSDRELAEALLHAEESGDSDELIYVENEICDRLDISPDETEQGLTQKASDMIDDFCRAQGFTVRGK